VSDDQLVVEEQVQLPMSSGNEAEFADVVGEPLQNFARYPSGPEGMSSGHTVFDFDLQLLDAVAIDHVAPLVCLRFSDLCLSSGLSPRPCGRHDNTPEPFDQRAAVLGGGFGGDHESRS
jgi:hypothetical protein